MKDHQPTSADRPPVDIDLGEMPQGFIRRMILSRRRSKADLKEAHEYRKIYLGNSFH